MRTFTNAVVNAGPITGHKFDAQGRLISPVWQFVFQDFSENNPSQSWFQTGLPIIGSRFNAEGLPQLFSQGSYMFGHSWGNLVITYACDMGHPAL